MYVLYWAVNDLCKDDFISESKHLQKILINPAVREGISSEQIN